MTVAQEEQQPDCAQCQPNKEAGLTQSDAAPLREKLANEVGDTIIYGLLILSLLDVNASDVLARVFDRKSVEYGFPERANDPVIPASPSQENRT